MLTNIAIIVNFDIMLTFMTKIYELSIIAKGRRTCMYDRLRVFCGLFVTMCALGAGFYIGWREVCSPQAPKAQEVTVYLPPRAEIHSSAEVEAKVFGIAVSQQKFQEFAATSSHNVLAVYNAKDGQPLVYEYWLSRGDGSWYHAVASTIEYPNWDNRFRVHWVQKNDRVWLAVPVRDHALSIVWIIISSGYAIFGLLLLFKPFKS